MKQKLSLGFTLIELLVVISILGILMSIVSVNLITAQKQARDARRLQDLEKIQTSMESYFGEFQVYPTDALGNLGDAFEGAVIPTDPKNSDSYAYDWSQTDTSAYCICALLETKTGNALVPSSSSCSWNVAGTYFCIQSQQ